MQEVGFVANPLLASLPEAGCRDSKVARLRPQSVRLQKPDKHQKFYQVMKRKKTDKVLMSGPLKSPDEYYNVRMMFNMTIEDKRSFENQMTACGFTSSQRFFREVLLRRKRVKTLASSSFFKVCSLDPGNAKLLRQELNKIGKNINQAVRVLNTRIAWLQNNPNVDEDWGALERDVNSMIVFIDNIEKTCELYGLNISDNT